MCEFFQIPNYFFQKVLKNLILKLTIRNGNGLFKDGLYTLPYIEYDETSFMLILMLLRSRKVHLWWLIMRKSDVNADDNSRGCPDWRHTLSAMILTTTGSSLNLFVEASRKMRVDFVYVNYPSPDGVAAIWFWISKCLFDLSGCREDDIYHVWKPVRLVFRRYRPTNRNRNLFFPNVRHPLGIEYVDLAFLPHVMLW